MEQIHCESINTSLEVWAFARRMLLWLQWREGRKLSSAARSSNLDAHVALARAAATFCMVEARRRDDEAPLPL